MKNKDFEEIYKKYHKNLLVYALSLCGDYQLAQSLVQATFTKAYLSYREGGQSQVLVVQGPEKRVYQPYQVQIPIC